MCRRVSTVLPKAVSLPCSSLTLCAQLLFAMLVNLSLILPYFAYPCRKDRCHRKGCGAEPSFEGMGTKMTLRLWCLTLGKNRPALSRAATSWKWNKSFDVERFPIENVKHGQNSFLMRLASDILSPVLFGLG